VEWVGLRIQIDGKVQIPRKSSKIPKKTHTKNPLEKFHFSKKNIQKKSIGKIPKNIFVLFEMIRT
jgi:hypothetical protein